MDGRISPQNGECTSQNSAISSLTNQASVPLYVIDFDEPSEYAIHFWFRTACAGTVSNYMVIDGPFKFKVNANNLVLTA